MYGSSVARQTSRDRNHGTKGFGRTMVRVTVVSCPIGVIVGITGVLAMESVGTTAQSLQQVWT